MEGGDIESGGTFVIKQPVSDPAPSFQDLTPGTVRKERYLIEREPGPGGKGIDFLIVMQFIEGVPLRSVERRSAWRCLIHALAVIEQQGGEARIEPGVGVARQLVFQLDALFASQFNMVTHSTSRH